MFGYRLVKKAELREQLQRVHEDYARRLEEARELSASRLATAATANARAVGAERMVEVQRVSIDRLMDSNERMVKLVSDMRRTGYGILEPIETRDVPETVDDVDRESVERHPELEAEPE